MSDKEQLSKFGSFRRKLLQASGVAVTYLALGPVASFASQNSETNSSSDAGLKVKASSMDSKAEALARLGSMLEQGASKAELAEGASVTYLNLNETKHDSLSYTKAFVKDGNIVVDSMVGDQTGRFAASFNIENSVLQPSEDGKIVEAFTESATLKGGFMSAHLTKGRVVCGKSLKDKGTKCTLVDGSQNGETIDELEDVFNDVLDKMLKGKEGNDAVGKKLDKKKGVYVVTEGSKIKEMHCALKKKPNASVAEKRAVLEEARTHLSTMIEQDFFKADVNGGAKYKSTSKTVVSAKEVPQPLMAFLQNDKASEEKIALTPKSAVPKPTVLSEPTPINLENF